MRQVQNLLLGYENSKFQLQVWKYEGSNVFNANKYTVSWKSEDGIHIMDFGLNNERLVWQQVSTVLNRYKETE